MDTPTSLRPLSTYMSLGYKNTYLSIYSVCRPFSRYLKLGLCPYTTPPWDFHITWIHNTSCKSQQGRSHLPFPRRQTTTNSARASHSPSGPFSLRNMITQLPSPVSSMMVFCTRRCSGMSNGGFVGRLGGEWDGTEEGGRRWEGGDWKGWVVAV